MRSSTVPCFAVLLQLCSHLCEAALPTGAAGDKQILGSNYGTPGVNATYDYVIIGGGTSGLTVARRLVASGAVSVAVVEAGGFYEVDAGNFTEIPANVNLLTDAPPAVDWGISTSPQPQFGNRTVVYTQGHCLGGSSGRNGMAYQRGTTGSYDQWASAVGDSSFVFSKFQAFFEKSVRFSPPDYGKRGGRKALFDASAFSSSGGPLHVSWWNWYIPVSAFIADALRAAGLRETASIQSGQLLGFAQYPATLQPTAQIRDSSESSFLRASLGSHLYTVYTRSLAKKILFAPNSKTATGVLIDAAGQSYSLTARKQVILAAGPFRTPQLLMVSGIGPAKTLKELGIPILADLPGVGQGFSDHGGFGIEVQTNVTTQHLLYSNATFAALAQEQYLRSQSGPLSAFASNYLAWENFPAAYRQNLSASARAFLDSFPADWPDLQYILSGLGLATSTPGNFAGIGVLPMKPQARGSVTITSPDTAVNPVVNPAWFATAVDKEIAIAGFRRARQLLTFWADFATEVLPGPAVQSDDAIWAYIQAATGPSHHAVATCKMGLPSDANAVVDAKGRLYGGITKLRIVDASIFPLLPPGQPMSTVYALAEKLSSDILSGC